MLECEPAGFEPRHRSMILEPAGHRTLTYGRESAEIYTTNPYDQRDPMIYRVSGAQL